MSEKVRLYTPNCSESYKCYHIPDDPFPQNQIPDDPEPDVNLQGNIVVKHVNNTMPFSSADRTTFDSITRNSEWKNLGKSQHEGENASTSLTEMVAPLV
jgi:hypothetical protein